MKFEGGELISVVMGVRYCRPDIDPLERSIRSILTQTHSNLEFLICQNDSSAAACHLLKSIEAEDFRIRLIHGDGAKTLAEKLNRCIAAANGKWIARQDDDDASAPKRLALQMDYLSGNADLAFAGCLVRIVQDGSVVGIRQFPECPVIHDFLFTQPFIHPTLIFRKDALIAVNGYCEEQRCAGCEDYDLLLRLYEKGYAGANLQIPCYSYTIPPSGRTNRTLSMRLNEVKTRGVLFRRMGLLPKALPYVIKPLLVGLIPTRLLCKLKSCLFAI